jgi:GNAT superfamily N-acetyltransferase
MADAVIRPYRPADRDALYDVCLRTADAGGDATPLYQHDPELPGDVYAGPYAFLEPDFAFVVDNGERVTGYVLGTPDTTRYVTEFRKRWLPVVGPKHPEPDHEPVTTAEHAAWFLHHQEAILQPHLADYPAHLHIDLLPESQRQGFGRGLITTILNAFRQAGAPAVHLAVLSANTNAIAFYERLGFHKLAQQTMPAGTYMGRSTTI